MWRAAHLSCKHFRSEVCPWSSTHSVAHASIQACFFAYRLLSRAARKRDFIFKGACDTIQTHLSAKCWKKGPLPITVSLSRAYHRICEQEEGTYGEAHHRRRSRPEGADRCAGRQERGPAHPGGGHARPGAGPDRQLPPAHGRGAHAGPVAGPGLPGGLGGGRPHHRRGRRPDGGAAGSVGRVHSLLRVSAGSPRRPLWGGGGALPRGLRHRQPARGPAPEGAAGHGRAPRRI